MSTAKPEKVMYKNPDGEIFDPEGAIKRHPALASLDVTLETSPAGDLGFTIRATRIAGRYNSEAEHLSHIDFKIPGEPADANPKLVTVVSEQAPISIEGLEGHTIGGQWRVIRALKPVKGTPHGGFILEHL